MIRVSESISAGLQLKSASLEATITRSDGTIIKLGEVARTDFTAAGRLKSLLGKAFR